MALQIIGSNVADWNTKDSLLFPSVEVEEGKAYAFFLQQETSPVATANQYCAVVAILNTSFGVFEAPLEAKYFPGLRGLIFSVAIPKASWDKEIELQMLLLPKEFKKGSATDKSITIQLSWDDKDIGDPSYPAG